ncbi:MAG: aspartate-semialdehyde dehydrogenase, partial [Candidatus Marinimicrobia bacterium]|nr:aspartate-semialdehyde dehydrogenase [Candidatus Neomarinimicrobiota bacterium]
MKKYRVAVVGAGAVGEEMIRLLYARDFPMAEAPKVLARSQRIQEIAGHEIQVEETTADAFAGLDFAFFAGTEGSKGASQVYGWDAVARGCVVIDNGDDFRMDPRVKLVVPEINAHELDDHQGFIANPNCSTIIALMAVGPLHQAAGVDRMVVCTYQAVSGTGAAAITELEEQVRAWAAGRT